MKQRNIARLFILTLTLALLWSPNTLPIHSSSQAAQAAANAIFTNPDDQPTSRAVANGKIAFVSNRDGGRPDIYTMNPDGSQVARLTHADENASGDGYDSPVWSPDGSKIAFGHHHVVVTGSQGEGLNEIFVTDSEAGNTRLLTPLGAYDSGPAWSPDSTQIALTKYSLVNASTRAYKNDIYAMNADGSNRRSLTSSNPNESASGPSWSPDGMKIAFSWFGGNTHTVRVMNADGSNQREILNGYLYPNAWCPVGSRLLVTPSATAGIWTVNPDGTSLTKIYESPHAPDSYAAWSPDGSKVAISTLYDCGDDDCNSEVIVVNADGSQPTQVGGEFAGSPIWSPDGTKILFSHYPDLFVMNAHGSGVTNVTNGSGGSEPSWQAIPITPSAIDDAQFFVRQQYLDFLNREADPGGLAYWTNRIAECGSDARCLNERRIGVSAAFFIEQEFQDTGYFVYRFYKASLGRQPNYTEFTSDRSRVIGGSNVDANKQAFADEWVQRPAFVTAYPITMSNTEVVNKLLDSAGLTASTYDSQRQQEIAAMNSGRSRALILRDVIEIPDFKNIADPNDPRYSEIKQTSQYNPAFVLMQYFGYLRRDVDQGGYGFWLNVLNNGEPNNYHGMVCAFITSTEYQLRFGSVVTRTNRDCLQ